jgi:hypothetical protein
MYILEAMKKDVNSVIGLTVGVEINGVSNAVIGVVKDTKVKNYSWMVDDVETKVPRYFVSFDEVKYFNVDRFTCGYEL